MKKKSHFPIILISFSILFIVFSVSLPLTHIDAPKIFSSSITPPSSAVDHQIIDDVLIGDGEVFTPTKGIINSTEYQIFWFLHITDTQDVWFEWEGIPRDNSSGPIQDINTFLSTTRDIIDPLFIVNTGDLVDSRYQNFFLRNDGQSIREWEIYNSTFSDHNLTEYNYFDLIGNHDTYRSPGFEHYLNYSISGSAFHTDQYVVTYNLGWGNYSFYMLSSVINHGMEYPFILGGEVSKAELNWLEQKLDAHESTSNASFVLGHHPMEGIRPGLSSSGKNLKSLLKKNEINAYIHGHFHKNQVQVVAGIPAIQTEKFREMGGSFRIFAVDGDNIATSTQAGSNWPMGIITSPASTQINRNEEEFNGHQEVEFIRALAWDPSGITEVEARVGGGPWAAMDHIEGPLYEISGGVNLQSDSDQVIEVRITNSWGISKMESMVYTPTTPTSFNPKNFIPLGYIGLISICIILPCVNTLNHMTIPKKKREEEHDPILTKKAKLVFAKLLVILFCPLSMGLFYAEKLTAIFGLFVLGISGVMYSDIILIFSTMIVLSSILPQSLSLTPKRGKWFRFFTGVGIFWSFFFIALYLIHYPAAAWASPGYYLLLYSDVKLMRLKN